MPQKIPGSVGPASSPPPLLLPLLLPLLDPLLLPDPLPLPELPLLEPLPLPPEPLLPLLLEPPLDEPPPGEPPLLDAAPGLPPLLLVSPAPVPASPRDAASPKRGELAAPLHAPTSELAASRPMILEGMAHLVWTVPTSPGCSLAAFVALGRDAFGNTRQLDRLCISRCSRAKGTIEAFAPELGQRAGARPVRRR
jgi:hypothetical protein